MYKDTHNLRVKDDTSLLKQKNIKEVINWKEPRIDWGRWRRITNEECTRKTHWRVKEKKNMEKKAQFSIQETIWRVETGHKLLAHSCIYYSKKSKKERQFTCNSLWSNILSHSKLITSDSPALNAWQWRWIYNTIQRIAINKLSQLKSYDYNCQRQRQGPFSQ